MKTVTFVKYDDAKNKFIEIGTIRYDGNEMIANGTRAVHGMLEQSIRFEASDEFVTKKQPDKFLSTLQCVCGNYTLMAGPVKET